jgi:RNA polymerase sigma-54 factor
MSTKLQLRNSLQVTITPVMHYFIDLLACNRMEFEKKLQNEVDSNPMLEIEVPETTVVEPEVNSIEKRLERADTSYLNHYEDQGFFKRSEDAIDKNKALELLTPSNETLSEHLMQQAMSALETEEELEIARQIIYNLDPDGYLSAEITSIAGPLKTTPDEIERIRTIIRGFEPSGCASQNLKECLIAQVDDTTGNSVLRQLIEHHLEDISRSRYDVILKHFSISMDELQKNLGHLRRLNPRPAESYSEQRVEYAEVDLMLVKDGGEYKVYYIEEGTPRLSISRYYNEMLDQTRDKATKSYLKSRHRDAQFLLESIDLRKKTIVRIAEYLVKAQKDFLDFGEKWKRPLTMKEVAQGVALNESTISRAVNNKFMATEKGLLSLKSFFSYGLKGDFGFSHSVDTIKQKLKEIIAEENPAKPLSDEELAKRLSTLGIKIARRTVRNYREELNIASTFIRRKENHLKGGKP